MGVLLSDRKGGPTLLVDDAGTVWVGRPRGSAIRGRGLSDFWGGGDFGPGAGDPFGGGGDPFGGGSFLPGTGSGGGGGGMVATPATPATTAGFDWTKLFSFGQGVLNSILSYKSASQRHAPFIPGGGTVPGGNTSVAFSSPLGAGAMSSNTLVLLALAAGAVLLLTRK